MTCASTMVHFEHDKRFRVAIRQESTRPESPRQWLNIYGDTLVDVALLLTDAQLQILGEAIEARLREIAPRMAAAGPEGE